MEKWKCIDKLFRMKVHVLYNCCLVNHIFTNILKPTTFADIGLNYSEVILDLFPYENTQTWIKRNFLR